MKYLFLTTVILLFSTLSCSKEKDYTNPKDLVGTIWVDEILVSYTQEIYTYKLEFLSETTVELHGFDPMGENFLFFIGIYEIEDARISILFTDDLNPEFDDYELFGTINKTIMNFTFPDIDLVSFELQ